MARYIATVRTSKPANETFEFMSDLRNFVDWDPGVVRSVQVEGDGPGPDAVYDVTVKNAGREMTLRYRVTEWDPPHRMKTIAKGGVFTDISIVEVSTDGDETVAVYDATLKMPFPLSLGDRLLRPIFNRIGDKAAAGLERALGGKLVA
jgi:carbon monoxide dehydrogenase subunit G